MSLVTIQWRPSPRELRRFGVSMIVGFGIIGTLLLLVWKLKTAAFVCFGFGGFAGLLGLSGTRAALPVYWAWMGVAFVMGNIVSRLILAGIYFLVVTPLAVLARLVGRDRLRLKSAARTAGWIDLPERAGPAGYERQF